MLEIGTFDPEKHRVHDDDIVAWSQLWAECVEYAKHAHGDAPPISYITRKFPDFELTPGINLEYAVSRVLDASSERSIRNSTRDAINALTEDDLSGAYEALAQVRPQRSALKPPASVFDVREVADRHYMKRIEVPYRSLQRATGGFGESELWIYGARSGHGKTWQLLNFAASAAAAGDKVAFVSLEMPHAQISLRALTVMSYGDREVLEKIRSSTPDEWAEGIEAIKAVVPGTIDVFDHTHGQITNVPFVKEICSDYDLTIIDHIGLMTNTGGKAVDDWRFQASISNELRAVALSESTRILAASQINREGLRGSASKPPPAEKLSGSDAIMQDADVVITMRRWSKKVVVHSAEKVRDGEEVRFYSWFDPRRGRFSEMTYEQATAQHDHDGGDFRDED